MQETSELINIIEYLRMFSAGMSTPAVLGLAFIMWRAGIISFNNGGIQVNGKETVAANGNGAHQVRIDKVEDSINEVKGDVNKMWTEVSEIRKDMGSIQSDIAFIRGSLSHTH